MMVQYDAAKHEYYFEINGRRRIVPSVTQCVGRAFNFPPFYADRGTKVHSAIHYLIKGTLNWDTVDPHVIVFVRAFQDFMASTGAIVTETESIVYHENPEFAGRFDAVLQLQNEWLVDWKTGAPSAWHLQQVALYSVAKWRASYKRAALLYLKSDGTFRWRPLTLAEQQDALSEGLKAVARWHDNQAQINFEV